MDTLLIFVRNPELGKVKTRLARGVGDERALQIYRYLLEQTRQTALSLPARRLLFYSESIPPEDEWPSLAFEKKIQAAGDLGARMSAAFDTAFGSGATKAIIIGSDCPELDGGLLRQAFKALDEADVVIGPAPDGGYYLLGLQWPEPTLFGGVRWSTANVLEDTLAIIRNLGKTSHLLPVRHDIDEPADWLAYCERHPDRVLP